MAEQQPVLIIGAGIAGLTLAQGLRKNAIPFHVFERDASPHARSQGWGLTIHFSLPRLLQLLPDDLGYRLPSTKVKPSTELDKSDSVFINLESCKAKWRLPPTYGNRMRVSRGRLPTLLLDGIGDQISWSKTLITFEPTHHGVRAIFSDGTSSDGALLVGVDGACSTVRSLLYRPEKSALNPLPVRFLGTSLQITLEQITPLLVLDPTLFQGCHPRTPTWMWFSILETPETNGTSGLPSPDHRWTVQVCISWILSDDDDSSIPPTDAGRIEIMRRLSENFHPRLKEIFHTMLHAHHTPIINIHQGDWYLPDESATERSGGRVVLAGDAAHTMPFYRGEGFNHAILDVYRLLQGIKRGYDPSRGDFDMAAHNCIVAEYEREVRDRGKRATQMCRAACLEVHRWDSLNERSVVRQKGVW